MDLQGYAMHFMDNAAHYLGGCKECIPKPPIIITFWEVTWKVLSSYVQTVKLQITFQFSCLIRSYTVYNTFTLDVNDRTKNMLTGPTVSVNDVDKELVLFFDNKSYFFVKSQFIKSLNWQNIWILLMWHFIKGYNQHYQVVTMVQKVYCTVCQISNFNRRVV